MPATIDGISPGEATGLQGADFLAFENQTVPGTPDSPNNGGAEDISGNVEGSIIGGSSKHPSNCVRQD